ncbi:unnamed protein product, partial [Anisakis simplex]
MKVHMGTHVWQQNPSRRGRRIFEFGTDPTSPLHAEMLSPLGAGGGGHGQGGGSDTPPIRAQFENPFRAAAAAAAAVASSFPPDHPMRNGGPLGPPPFSCAGLPFPLPLLPALVSGGSAGG